VLAALFDLGLPIIVVATKVDKLSSAHKVDQALQTINMELGLPEGQPLCISSVSGQGVKDLWKIIMEACEDRVDELKSKIEGGTDALDDELDGSTYEEIKALVEERTDDEDEIAYSQGYDWLQGAEDFEDESFFGSDDDYEWDGKKGDEADLNVIPVQEKSSIESLRRRAKDMERKGEI
jgi:GTP-binding protein